MKVLIAEDDFYLRDQYKTALSQLFTIDIIADGDKAVDKLKQDQYDIVLLDVMLPSLRGDQLVDMFPDQPFVLASNLGITELKIIYDKYPNVIGYLQKSNYTPKQIGKILEDYICKTKK